MALNKDIRHKIAFIKMYLQKRDLYVFVGVFFREMNLKFGLITPKILRGGTNKQKSSQCNKFIRPYVMEPPKVHQWMRITYDVCNDLHI